MPSRSKSTRGSSSRRDRPKTTDGGDPTVTSRGDDKKSLLNKWGQRGVHLLLVVIPLLFIGGYVFQVFGIHAQSMRFAAAVAGVILTATGIIAVAMVLVDSYRKSRQTELTEFLSYRD